MFAPRPEGAGGRFAGKPAFGGKPFGKKPFAPRNGFAPRGGSFERAPFERDASRAADPRAPQSVAPRGNPFDRAPATGRDRDHNKSATFAPRKPGAPAGKGGFKPQRPRSGGFSR